MFTTGRIKFTPHRYKLDVVVATQCRVVKGSDRGLCVTPNSKRTSNRKVSKSCSKIVIKAYCENYNQAMAYYSIEGRIQ